MIEFRFSFHSVTETPKTPLSHDRRKRKKLSNHDGDLNASGANASIDLNNAAFLLSSTYGEDDDVIDPTQFSKTPSPLRVNVNRSVVSRKPFVDSNKENFEKVPVSPSLCHRLTKSAVTGGTGGTSVRKNLFEETGSFDDDNQLNESKASERLLPNWMSKKKSTAVATVDANKPMAKKKNRLSLGKTQSNTPKLRQATINFQAKSELKNDDETYCAEFATFQPSGTDTSMNRDSPSSSPTVSSGDSIRNAMERIKIEKTSPLSSKERAKGSSHGSDAMHSEPMSKIEPNTGNVSTNAVIILDDPISEIITLDDTQSSADDYEHIFGTQSEDLMLSKQPRKLGPFQPEVAAIASRPAPAKKSDNAACPDCIKVRPDKIGIHEKLVSSSSGLVPFTFSTIKSSEVP